MTNNPEKDIEEFLASLPARKRKEFEQGLTSLTEGELLERNGVEQFDDHGLTEEYERLLQRIPAKWGEYRRRRGKEFVQVFFPPNSSGRPRKDALADEAERLRKTGLTWGQVAIQINGKFGKGTTTSEKIRALLKARRARVAKTPTTPEIT